MPSIFPRAAIALAVVCVAAAAPALAADATGKWLTKDGNATVAITRCGDALCGTILALKDPKDPATGRPRTDKNNPDAAKAGRPLVGVQIVFDMRPGRATGTWDGKVYNAEDGKTYTGSIALTSDDTLDLKGCAFGGFICKSQTWTRAK